MQSKATTVEAYLKELPADRRAALTAVRKVILENLDKDFEEGMGYGMIGYHVPHSVYPPGYHCNPAQPLPFAGLASQKNYMSVYMMSAYGEGGDEKWLREQFARAGKKLDMGKCCIRFKKLEDLPLGVIGEAIRRVPAKAYIEHYETAIRAMNKRASGASSRKSAGRAPKTAATNKKSAAPRRSSTAGAKPRTRAGASTRGTRKR